MTRSTQGTGKGDGKVTRGWLRRRLFSLIGLATLVALISALVLELHAGGTAFVMAEGHWSRAQKELVYGLSRYLGNDDAGDLEVARRALQRLQADSAARSGMDQAQMDVAQVRRDLIGGGNRPGDVDRLIRMYRYGRNLPYMQQAVSYWVQTEPRIQRLAQIVAQLEACNRASSGCPQPVVRQALQNELEQIDGEMRPLAEAFSRNIADGIAVVRVATLAVLLLGLLVLTVYAIWTARRIRRYVSANESRFRAAFHQAAVGMAQLDLHGHVLEVNQALGEILGYSQQQLRQMTIASLIEPGSLAQTSTGRIDWSQRETPDDNRFRHADGHQIWCRWSASEIEQSDGRVERVLMVIEDVSQARLYAEELAHQASHDSLTGLINRREVERRLGVLLARSRDPGGPRHSLCFVDLDHFKLVNDTFGHVAGDAALRRFALFVSARLRPGDWIGRLGGDEFAILLAGTPLAESVEVLEPLRQALASPTGELAPLRGSFGVIEIGPTHADLNGLLTAADLACYAAKESGRNQVRCFDAPALKLIQRQREGGWVSAVRQAIAEGRLKLYAQRIQDLDQPTRLRYEVLVRLQDEDGVVRLAGEFLPSVERYGLGDILDRHVLQLVIGQLASLPKHSAEQHLCHVNLSAQSIGRAGFEEFVYQLLDQHPQLCSNLCLEITETAVVADPLRARHFIDEVRGRGCKVALDDFGSGLASFGYLKQFPADLLKIDGSFIRGLANDRLDRATVEAIAQVGHALSLDLVAEGVEDAATRDLLEGLGIRSMQGFFIHRPCPLPELLKELAADE